MIRGLFAAAIGLVPAMLAAQVIEPGPGRLELVGTANPACVVQAPHSSLGDNMTFDSRVAGYGEIRILRFVDDNARSRGGAIELAIPMICNAPHRLSVRSDNGGLRRLGSSSSTVQFEQFVPYEIGAFWAGRQTAGGTQDGALALDSAQAQAGEIRLTVKIAAGDRQLGAGTYSDLILLEMQPQY